MSKNMANANKDEAAEKGKKSEVKTEDPKPTEETASETTKTAQTVLAKARISMIKEVEEKRVENPRVRRFNNTQVVDMRQYPPQKRKKRMLFMLRDYYQQYGQYPTESDWKQAEMTPAVNFYKKLFGSWGAAIKAAKELPPKFEYKIDRKPLYKR